MANNMTNIPASLEEDVKVQNYISRLADLRSTGVTRISDLKQQIHSAKKSKMMAQETKAKLIEDCKKQIDAAKADAAQHKSEIDALTKEAVSYVNSVSAEIEKKVNESENANIARYKREYQEKAAAIKAETAKKIAALTVSDPIESKAEI